ncbi:MAG TPA: FTR1 family protein [Frateuria sp.]|uniref:FTR1 family protein n=1 Tax=Frateuria sp. TaxID=2211372 RepID=UPI002D7FCA42|nr:FTR1 family protein [Frateuria sp.]HET6804907.1 FTR1 family protein [Frateuria sp.]
MIGIRNKWAARLLLACLLIPGSAVLAQALPPPPGTATTAGAPAPATVDQTWQMLDYLATDYAGAVHDGRVVSASEYAEMREFAGTVRQRLAQWPPGPAMPSLQAQAARLVHLIDNRAGTGVVAHQAHALADALLAAYPVPTAPTRTPDLARGAVLYRQTCAACHGARGQGDGPAAAALEPPPIDFTDRARADQRSVLSLFEAISQGVKGTAMAGYADRLPADDRWSLAYYVGSLAYAHQAGEGAEAWKDNAAARARLDSLETLSRARVEQLAPALGERQARAILGYLRAYPHALPSTVSGLALAREKLAASLAAWHRGEPDEAGRLALSAYLDGVEPVEPQLDARDAALRAQLETAMGAYRTAVAGGGADVIARERAADELLQRGQALLAGGSAGVASAFIGAWTILVREGLEALLVVVALLAFLRKAERPAMLRYVHAGWSLALLAGLATWAVASYAVAISGAGRELTEGLSSLFAAVVLLCVGLWMHRKSVGGRWQAYLKAKMAATLDRSAWFLFGLAFLSVYREVFETILFYVAMWNEGPRPWLLGGIGAGAATLAVIAWVLLRTSRRLPLGKFFSASSALIAVLAVVLTGKGIAALQEAGWIGVHVAPLPRIELLGIYPTWQSFTAQAIVALVLAAGYGLNLRRVPG